MRPQTYEPPSDPSGYSRKKTFHKHIPRL